MKVTVAKPLLFEGRTIPAGSVIDLPSETVQALGDRIQGAKPVQAPVQVKTVTKVPSKNEADADDADDEKNENHKE